MIVEKEEQRLPTKDQIMKAKDHTFQQAQHIWETGVSNTQNTLVQSPPRPVKPVSKPRHKFTFKTTDVDISKLKGVQKRPDYQNIIRIRMTILEKWEIWDQNRKGDVFEDFQQFFASLHAEGTLPSPAAKKLSLNTLYRWKREYKKDGIQALVPEFHLRGQKEQIGTHAWDYFFKLVQHGDWASMAMCYKLTCAFIEKYHKEETGWEWVTYEAIRQKMHHEFADLLKQKVANRSWKREK